MGREMKNTEECQPGRIARVTILLVPMLALGWVIASPSALRASEQAQKQQSKEKDPPPAKSAAASMTGCVDEQEGSYLLLSDQTMNPIASLVADGFDKEDFAKHVGHKVTVRGTSNPQGAGLPQFKVKTIEKVSETCAPQR